MGVMRTYADLTTEVTVADAAREITSMWLSGDRIQDAGEESTIVTTAPRVRASTLAGRLYEGCVFRGTSPLGSAVLKVFYTVLAPQGGDAQDAQRAVAELDKLRPTSNGIGRGRGQLNPHEYVTPNPFQTAMLLTVIAGLELDFDDQLSMPQVSVRIQAALAKLAELEPVSNPT